MAKVFTETFKTYDILKRQEWRVGSKKYILKLNIVETCSQKVISYVRRTGCGAGLPTMSISNDGTVYTCASLCDSLFHWVILILMHQRFYARKRLKLLPPGMWTT